MLKSLFLDFTANRSELERYRAGEASNIMLASPRTKGGY